MRRFWRQALAAVVVVFAAAGALFAYFQTYQPDRSRFPLRGIDVSHHQGTIDWPEVAKDDVAFAFIKVSEGGDHLDTQFERNITEATKAGIAVGAYHFFTFCRPGTDQAHNFLRAVAGRHLALPPVMDLEFTGNCRRRLSAKELSREIAAYIDIVESRLDRRVVYYVTRRFLDEYVDAIPPRPIWLRSILRKPSHVDWLVWQYHFSGRVAGIEGGVDLNVASVSLAQLIQSN